MYLEKGYYKNNITHDLEMATSLLQPSVEEISRRCGGHNASRLQVLLEKLRYLQYDALKYASSLLNIPIEEFAFRGLQG